MKGAVFFCFSRVSSVCGRNNKNTSCLLMGEQTEVMDGETGGFDVMQVVRQALD